MKTITNVWAKRAAFAALLLAGVILLPVAAYAQNPMPMQMNCRQIWDDAANEAGHARRRGSSVGIGLDKGVDRHLEISRRGAETGQERRLLQD
jgi:hypothetical protein